MVTEKPATIDNLGVTFHKLRKWCLEQGLLPFLSTHFINGPEYITGFLKCELDINGIVLIHRTVIYETV